MTTVARTQSGMNQKLLGGVVGGLVGGVVFGMLMAMMGMLPMIASLVGSNSAVAGFLLHMVISAGIGASFGLLFGARSTSPAQGPPEVRFTHEALAEMAGTYRETATKIPNEFRAQGLIELKRGCVLLINERGLRTLSERIEDAAAPPA
jgi:hypothetical protein